MVTCNTIFSSMYLVFCFLLSSNLTTIYRVLFFCDWRVFSFLSGCFVFLERQFCTKQYQWTSAERVVATERETANERAKERKTDTRKIKNRAWLREGRKNDTLIDRKSDRGAGACDCSKPACKRAWERKVCRECESGRESTRVRVERKERERQREKEGPEGVVKSAALKKSSFPQVPSSIPAENTSNQIYMDLSKYTLKQGF